LSLNLKEAGLTRKIIRKLASKRDEIRREKFETSLCTDFTGNGSESVILDETSKHERTYARRYGRALSEKCAQLTDIFVRGDRYPLCAAMTINGYTAAHVVKGSFDSEEFYDFIIEEVVKLYSPISISSQ
jgi:hypothetical protein